MLKRLFLFILGLCCYPVWAMAQESAYYFEDFENLSILGPSMPDGWSTNPLGGFSLHMAGGVDGSQALYASVSGANERYIQTQSMSLGEAPVLEFAYKTTGILGDPDPNCLNLYIAASEDQGETWTGIDTVRASDFVASTTYAIKYLDLKALAGKTCAFKISVVLAENAGSASFYLDNFAMGTPTAQLSHDLAIDGPLSGPQFAAMNTTNAYTVSVLNNGSETESDYVVRLCDEDGLVLDSVQGEELAVKAKSTYTLNWIPTVAGEKTLQAQIVFGDDENPDNNTSDPLTVSVLESGVSVQVGSGSDKIPDIPFGFYDKSYVSQVLYPASDLQYIRGNLSKIAFFGDFKVDLKTEAQVWIGETDSNSFSSYVNPASLTKVYQGELVFAEGTNSVVEIPFATDYAYTGKNLIVYAFCKNEEVYSWEEKIGSFASTNSFDVCIIGMSGTIDPQSPPEDGFSFKFSMPNTTFFFKDVIDEKYILDFNITDNTGAAIEDAIVHLEDWGTAEVGEYTFEDMPSRMYKYRISKNGYVSAQGSVVLFSDTTVDIVMKSLGEVPGVNGFVLETFEEYESGRKPYKWSGDFTVEENGGIDGGKRLTHSFFFLDGPRQIQTAPIYMGENPVFEFFYRAMDYETYPNNTVAASNLRWEVRVSTDMGKSWQKIYSNEYGSHIESGDYKRFTLDVTNYANEVCQFLLFVERDYTIEDEFYFDIDNWTIGTRQNVDLCVVSPLETSRINSRKAEAGISVNVKNIGKESVETYTVSLYKGDELLDTKTGTVMEPGSATTFDFSYIPENIENAGWYAVVESAADEDLTNNTSATTRISTVDSGTVITTIKRGEGNDVSSMEPITFYVSNSISQNLYFPDELNLEKNTSITGLAYKTNFSMPLEKKKFIVWVGETDSTFLNSSFVPLSETKKVFEGALNFSNIDGDNLIIDFQTPYLYQGGNLVVCLYKEDVGAQSEEEDFGFYGLYSLSSKNRYYFTDETIDIKDINNNGGSLYFHNPSVCLLSRTGIEYYQALFKIVDPDQKPIENATLTFNGVTLLPGVYTVSDIPEGTYPYSVNGPAGQYAEGEIRIEDADVTETVILRPTSNENQRESTMISVYPNPSNGKFHVEISENAREVHVYDIYGKQVYRQSRVSAGSFEIDLSKFRSGLYLLMVDGQAFKITKR